MLLLWYVITISSPIKTMDAACWVSWGEGIETPSSTGSSWRPPSMHCLHSFAFVTFLIIWPLSPAASGVSWYWSCLFCSGLAYEIYSRDGPSTYVYCVVCYHVIVAPYIRSVGHVFAYLYTVDDYSERPMDYETSLLPKVCLRFALAKLVVCMRYMIGNNVNHQGCFCDFVYDIKDMTFLNNYNLNWESMHIALIALLIMKRSWFCLLEIAFTVSLVWLIILVYEMITLTMKAILVVIM